MKEDLRAMSQWKITVQYEGHESKQRSKSHFNVIANLSFSSLEARQNNFIIAPKNNNKIKIIKNHSHTNGLYQNKARKQI